MSWFCHQSSLLKRIHSQSVYKSRRLLLSSSWTKVRQQQQLHRALSHFLPSPVLSTSLTSPIEKAEAFADLITSTKFAVLSSTSNDPFVNLSIEYFLLQRTQPDSVILFNYVNQPCVVIGRNQNPWSEVNLSHVKRPASLYKWTSDAGDERSSYHDRVDLVRRRTGGGTVFHDDGNINYCVICPKDDFTRNKYAEMVVRALRNVNPRVRVNERHDIVLDQGTQPVLDKHIESSDTHRTCYEDPNRPALKVSGSAFKITRLRAMHHGTCLLHSPNLPIISSFLRSPAASYIKALGVDSVRSPVGNVRESSRSAAVDEFREAIMREFFDLHNAWPDRAAFKSKNPSTSFEKYCMVRLPSHQGDLTFGWIDEDHAQLPEIKKGVDELQDPNWVYGQTPKFSFSTHPTKDDPRERLEPDVKTATKPRFSLAAKQGIIEDAHIVWSKGHSDIDSDDMAFASVQERQERLIGAKLYEINDILPLLSVSDRLIKQTPEVDKARQELGEWLNETLCDPATLHK